MQHWCINKAPFYSFLSAYSPHCGPGRRTQASSQTSRPSTSSWSHSCNINARKIINFLFYIFMSEVLERLQRDSHFIRGVGGFGHPVASLQSAVEQLIHGQIRVGGSSCREHFKSFKSQSWSHKSCTREKSKLDLNVNCKCKLGQSHAHSKIFPNKNDIVLTYNTFDIWNSFHLFSERNNSWFFE